MIRVGINGFGRIGRLAFREIITSTDFDIVAINTPSDAESVAYLMKYDSVHRSFHPEAIKVDGSDIVIKDKKRIKTYQFRDPEEIPWKELDIDIVLECSGHFTTKEDLEKHLKAGAKKVLLSAPAKGDVKTIIYGVNDNDLNKDDKIISASSCTTNCLVPILKVMNDKYGIKKGYMTTVHAYTSDQNILDNSHKKGIYSRRGRAGAENIVPTSSGATSSVALILPELAGKVGGMSLRVPSPNGSVVDLTLELSKEVTKEEINKAFKSIDGEIIKYSEDPLVSTDIIGYKEAAIFDSLSTEVLKTNNGELVKLLIWYDNEVGYTNQMLRIAKKSFE